MIRNVIAAACLPLALAGCGSAYSSLTSSVHGLGAQEYQPSVDVPLERLSLYQSKDLPECRQIAAYRQATAAQEAQQETLGGAVEGASQGASFGYQYSQLLDSAGYDVSRTKSTLGGALGGLVASVGSAFSSGQSNTSSETRRVLLNCLRSRGYAVLE